MTPAEITRELDELESRLERLRIKYDQYFTGIEKMLPFVQRKDVDRRFAQLHKEQFRNAGLRFRFQTMVQRFTTYQTYWGRIVRQIEEGTFKRDALRAQRLGRRLDRQAGLQAEANDANDANAAPEITAEPDAAEPMELDDDDISETTMHASRGQERESFDFGSVLRAPTPAPIPAAATPAAPSPAVRPGSGGAVPRVPRSSPTNPVVPGPNPNSPLAPRGAPVSPVAARSTPTDPGVRQPGAPLIRPAPLAAKPTAAPAPKPAPAPAEDPSIRSLHQRFVEARRMTGENTDVQYESIARQARENVARLSQKYQGAEVRMDVSIKDGKAILKPVVVMPKKG